MTMCRDFGGACALAILAIIVSPVGLAQMSEQAPQSAAQNSATAYAPHGGSATAGEFAPILDSEKRPITKGGFVKTGPIIFQDVTAKAGLTSWRHTMGTLQKNYIIETTGSGVALLDYDGDGWLDIFVSNFGKNRLYRNNHDGTFSDTAEKAGVTLGNWSNGPTFGDYDGDGRLDLFVPGYVHYDVAHPPRSGFDAVAFQFCEYRGAAVSCGPRGLEGEPDHLFHNNGDGTFTDVSEKAGVSDPHHYFGFSSTFVGVNDDGKVDLVVANDSSSNFLYLNNGDGTFEDASYYSGFALNQTGRETASMGLAVGDYKNTGMVDMYTTTISDDYKTLYENRGNGNFRLVTNAASRRKCHEQ
jgi:hypothetical protein